VTPRTERTQSQGLKVGSQIGRNLLKYPEHEDKEEGEYQASKTGDYQKDLSKPALIAPPKQAELEKLMAFCKSKGITLELTPTN